MKNKLEEDDAEIAELEKKLGLKKGKKLPKAFDDDGLGDLLDGLDDLDDLGGAAKGKRKRGGEDEAWLESKRQKQAVPYSKPSKRRTSSSKSEDSPSDEEKSFEGFSEEEASLDGDLEEEDDDFDLLDSEAASEEEDGPPPPVKRVRENPYAPPVPAGAATPKYIPPSRRSPPSSDAEALSRLKRQTQGLLNRLGEANLLSILRDIEQLYQDNPRQFVTSTVLDLLFALIYDRSALTTTFLVLHAGFVAALYKIIGADFGAQLVERLVEQLDESYSIQATSDDVSGKQATNLVTFMSELYNFQVIGPNLIFDCIRLFLKDLSELNTELLLRIINSKSLTPLPLAPLPNMRRFWPAAPTR